jgi:hypothetical protein
MAAPVRKVHFYSVEAADETRPSGFSTAKVMKAIDGLNRENDEAYLQTGYFDRLLGLVHAADQPVPMLSVWMIDTVNAPHFEHKGTIKDYHFMDGEGVAEPAYAMFFKDRIMALLRPVYRSPGPSAIAEYINRFAKVNCAFDALVQPNILKQLQRPAEDVVFAKFHIKTRNLSMIRDVSPDVEAALRAAAMPTDATEVTVIWKAALKGEKAHWWSKQKPINRDLIQGGVIDAFEHATVQMTGNHPVDLMSQQLTESVAIDLLPGEKHVKPEAAAEALMEAYNRRKGDLDTSAKLADD